MRGFVVSALLHGLALVFLRGVVVASQPRLAVSYVGAAPASVRARVAVVRTRVAAAARAVVVSAPIATAGPASVARAVVVSAPIATAGPASVARAVVVSAPIAAAGPASVTLATSASSAPMATVTEFRPPPHYPEDALDQRIEGDILIQVQTDMAGNVVDAQIVKSSGESMLDDEALTTVRRWRLQPSKKLRVPIQFHLS